MILYGFARMCSYRGYGLSEGRPNQRGLQMDADAGLRYVMSRDDLATDNVVLFGRSLGGAVAIHLAAEQQASVSAGLGSGEVTMRSGDTARSQHVMRLRMSCTVWRPDMWSAGRPGGG